jgi:hypothetical protein
MGNTKPNKTSFKPGAKPGPGRPRVPDEVKEARKLTKVLFEEIVHKFTAMSKQELTAHLQNPNTPTLELMVGMVVKEAIVRGDQTRLNFLLDRIVGKVKEHHEHSGSDGEPIKFIVEDYRDK